MYLNTTVAQFGQLAEKSNITTGYDMAILKPVVEYVAQ